MNHLFEVKSFSRLTYCEHCKQLLWGIVKQGVKCKECGYVCHIKCQASVPLCFSSTESRAETYLRQLSKKSGVEPQTKKPATLCESIFSDKIQDILLKAATTSTTTKDVTPKQTPLNPQVTTRNFTRFVSRCGPVFGLRDELLSLLSWEKPVKTLISMFFYCVICLYPKLVFLVPQLLVFYILLLSKETKKKATKKTKEKIQAPSDTAPLPNIFKLEDASPEYLRNLQYIQNMMGEFSDAYDWFMVQRDYLSSFPKEKSIPVMLVLTFFLTIVICFTPIKTIFLSTGIMVYLVHTRFVKHVLKETFPYLLEFGKHKWVIVAAWYGDLEEKLEKSLQLEEVSVYENQRFWPKHGYIPKMLDGERSAWSDFGGIINMPKMIDMVAPPGYQWKEQSEWTLDTTGPWIDTYLGLEVFVKPDNQGWIYSDDYWNTTTTMTNVTRRRRWVRKCDKKVSCQ